MKDPRLVAVILAAGEGKRMRSPLPKVLHRVAGIPMVLHVVEAAKRLGATRTVVVVGHGRREVREVLAKEDVTVVCQEQQLGTGDAVRAAEGEIREHRGEVVILSGDVPLVRPETLTALVEDHRRRARAATVVTAELEEPGSLGRVVRDAKGHIHKIVEVVDASSDELRLREINAGIYCFAVEELLPSLRRLDRENAQGQYYLTDTIQILREEGKAVGAWIAPRAAEVLGVNTPGELAQAERIYGEREG